MHNSNRLGNATMLILALLALFAAGPLLAADIDEDGLDDAWEIKWFGNIELYTAGDDPDQDGLSNELEYSIDPVNMNPAHWDTDGDGFDDKWEYIYSVYDPSHLDPTAPNPRDADYDGDGLSTWQEYCGVDGKPAMVTSGSAAGGVTTGKPNGAEDSLNPLDIDTDYDMLIDSFEAAWYDPDNNIDPVAGTMNEIPLSNNTDTSIARGDSDRDGLTNYREQCLLFETGVNGSLWDWKERIPFPMLDYTVELDDSVVTVRVCLMAFIGSSLDLGLDMNDTISNNRFELRNHEWTDPTDSTGYFYTDEELIPGHDTDDDGLPDGWEVEFGLDPRDDGLSGANWDNGPLGDPDGDGIWNIDEYLGQDGLRSTTDPFISGSGDETNPNQHRWRPDSVYSWRWLPKDAPISYLTDARNGTGIAREETLGSALPSAALTNSVNTYNSDGYDWGQDSDDDGIPDPMEINGPLYGLPSSSPVHSTSPFIPRSALITDAAGIPLPDPEPAEVGRMKPAGIREDLQGRDWTIECYVKLLDNDLSGHLFNFETELGGSPLTVYRLSLSNNVPVLVANNNSAGTVAVVAANELPTDEWVHLAGVWDHQRNTLSLYIHGMLQQGLNLFGESASAYYAPATNDLALAVSPDGSFVDRLMLDEVRIWGIARTSAQINRYSKRLAPQNTGDDVWLNSDNTAYYTINDTVLVNGGSLFEGEPGIPLDNVLKYEQSYWIDNGDGIYRQSDDILLKREMDTLVEGAPGEAVSNVYYNDKDGSGDFSANSLLAYYRFDDGGRTAEDFARKAKSSLTGATRENYSFGDFGYALASDNFEWVDSDAAPVIGAQPLGADDSDGDGMPDAWEIINHLDPYDDGTGQETAPRRQDGPYGALGDPDGDGLTNIYEYWSQTNPLEFDTDGDGSPDSQADLDGDGVSNGTEQLLGSRPDIVDTDDDGSTDSEEQALGTDPINSASPAKSLSLELAGGANDFAQIPSSTEQRLESWTIEAWVKPDTVGAGDQIVLRRLVEQLPRGVAALNYVLGLRPAGAELELFTGYVDLSGAEHTIAGVSVAVGDWTHVAATYDIEEATMNIYTNGVAATSTSQFYAAPPLNGKGGETFTRIGENFDGRIDDLRLWASVRTAEEIAENYETAIADTGALVHYFRFDDGAADETEQAFGVYHQPRGAEDFVYRQDWNEQWLHAANLQGDVGFAADSPIVTPATLQILIEPDQALLDGALWSLDGGAWNQSGDTLSGIDPGDHTLAFKSLNGWTAPEIETVGIASSTETILRRTYVENGALTVGLEPIEAVDSGAAWRIDGGEWQLDGATLQDLSPGSYYVEFQSVAGWHPPVIAPVEVLAGEETSITRFYTPIEGPLQVAIAPAGAVGEGAQWRVDGGDWFDSEDTSAPLSYGTHVVEFRDIASWESPDPFSVDIVSSTTTVVTGRYTQVTGIYMELSPADVAASGAVWRVSGGEWQSDRSLLELEPGDYTVEFEPVEGWTTPAARQVSVSNDITTAVSASYYRTQILGEFGTGAIPGKLNSPRGIAFDSSGLLYIADSGNNCVQVYDPSIKVWLQPIGETGTSPEQFQQPLDVFIDGADNLYVADSGNNRIQKRSASGGSWTVWGGTAAGMGAGEFDGPFGVAVDSSGNLYVADLYNHRVQKRALSGTWSTIVESGFNEGQTRYPRDIQILPNGNILLADHVTTPADARLREFSATGTYIGRLGGNGNDEGAFSKLGSIAVHNSDIYAVDMQTNRVSLGDTASIDWEILVDAGLFNSPEGIAYSTANGLFVADTANHRIVRIDVPTSMAPLGQALVVNIQLIANNAPESEQPAGMMSLMSLDSDTTADAQMAVEILWNSEVDTSYRIEIFRSSNATGEWVTLQGADSLPGSGGIQSFEDTSPGDRVKLYRLIKNQY